MTNAPHAGGGTRVSACSPPALSCPARTGARPAPSIALHRDPLARLTGLGGLHPASLGLLFGGARLLGCVLESTDDPLLLVAAMIGFICAPCAFAQRLLFRESWWQASGKAAAVLLLLVCLPTDGSRWALLGLTTLGALSLRLRRAPQT